MGMWDKQAAFLALNTSNQWSRRRKSELYIPHTTTKTHPKWPTRLQRRLMFAVAVLEALETHLFVSLGSLSGLWQLPRCVSFPMVKHAIMRCLTGRVFGPVR